MKFEVIPADEEAVLALLLNVAPRRLAWSSIGSRLYGIERDVAKIKKHFAEARPGPRRKDD